MNIKEFGARLKKEIETKFEGYEVIDNIYMAEMQINSLYQYINTGYDLAGMMKTTKAYNNAFYYPDDCAGIVTIRPKNPKVNPIGFTFMPPDIGIPVRKKGVI